MYLTDSLAKDAFIAGMRRLFEWRPAGVGAPPARPRLESTDFTDAIPPTTQPVPGLKGVSHAQQPLEDGWALQEVPIPERLSFGDQLAEMVAAALKEASSKPAFFTAVEANFFKRGMDVNQPWQYLLTQANRDGFAAVVAPGEAARRRRGW